MRAVGLARGVQETLFIPDDPCWGALQGVAPPGPPGSVLLHGGWWAQEPKAWLRRLTASWGCARVGLAWGPAGRAALVGSPSVWFFRSSRDKRWGEHGAWAPRGCSVGLEVGCRGRQHLHRGLG